MPIFDATVTLEVPRVTVIDAIKRILKPQDTVITLREAPVLLSLCQDVGYVYVIASKDGVSCKLRLIVDKVSKVRDAFRAHSPREAVAALAQTPNTASNAMQLEAAALLETIREEVRASLDAGMKPRQSWAEDDKAKSVEDLPAARWTFLSRLLRSPQ